MFHSINQIVYDLSKFDYIWLVKFLATKYPPSVVMMSPYKGLKLSVYVKLSFNSHVCISERSL